MADDLMRTDVCVFAAQEDLETMQAFAQVSVLKLKRWLPPLCNIRASKRLDCHLKHFFPIIVGL